jgi:uncharacterized membrane protein YdjX (TVP38/TMEM64 family)
MSASTFTLQGLPRSMTTWMKLLSLAVALVVGWWGLSSLDYEQYLIPSVLAQRLHEAGPLAPLLLIASMATAVVIPPIPSLPLDLAAGAAFGPFYGALYAVIGAEIGAIACFLVARALGRDALSRVLKTEATFCQKCTDHQLMGLMFVARLIPVFSFDVVSYGAGLTNISLKSFAFATLFGMAPPTFALTYLGSSVVSAQGTLIAAGVAMVALFLATPKFLVKYRTSRIACLVLGPVPPLVSTVGPAPVHGSRAKIPLQIRCAGCGAPMP